MGQHPLHLETEGSTREVMPLLIASPRPPSRLELSDEKPISLAVNRCVPSGAKAADASLPGKAWKFVRTVSAGKSQTWNRWPDSLPLGCPAVTSSLPSGENTTAFDPTKSRVISPAQKPSRSHVSAFQTRKPPVSPSSKAGSPVTSHFPSGENTAGKRQSGSQAFADFRDLDSAPITAATTNLIYECRPEESATRFYRLRLAE
jgi:hypothetical protein